MIHKIFLPRHINGYYFLPHTILGIHIGSHAIIGTLIVARGSAKRITWCSEELLPINDELNYEDKVIQALKALFERLPSSYDQIIIALPSTSVIFKKITLPFIDEHKIKLVAPFEIEEQLPFSMQDALLDTLITKKIDSREAQVFAAAMQVEDLEPYQRIWGDLGIEPDKVTIDTFELYGLYKNIPQPEKPSGVVALIYIDIAATQILLLIDGTLQAVRTVHKGAAHLIGEKNSNDTPLYDYLKRLDLNDVSQQEASTSFFNDIHFNALAALKAVGYYDNFDTILLTGYGAEIPGVVNAVCNNMHVPCETLNIKALLHKAITVAPTVSLSSRYVMGIATALPYPVTEDFDMRPGAFSSTKEERLFTYRVFTSIALVLTLFISFFLYSWHQQRSLSKHIANAQQQASKKLTSTFGITKKKRLSDTVNEARQKLATEESIWFSLAKQSHYSFLHYLQRLSAQVSREELGLDLKRLTFQRNELRGEDIMRLDGSVKNYDALRTFEEALRETKLFKSVPEMQETKFDISLVIERDI